MSTSAVNMSGADVALPTNKTPTNAATPTRRTADDMVEMKPRREMDHVPVERLISSASTN